MLIVLNKKRFALKLIIPLAVVFAFGILIKLLSGYILQANSEHDFTQILNQAFEVRNAAILTNDAKADESLYDTQNGYGSWTYQYEAKRIEYLHKWADKQGVEFTDIQSKITITSTYKADEGYSFHFICPTEYRYSYNDNPSASNLFRIVTYHYISLAEKEGKWRIENEWYLDPVEYSLDEENIGSEAIRDCISSGKARDFSGLNEYRVQAVAYADRYCGASGVEEYGVQYNKSYKNYNGIGGDCTNFISQVLYEGGKFRKNPTWNYEREGSSAWCQASAFLDYMLYSGRASQIACGTYDQVLKASYSLEPGDIISYVRNGKVEHSVVVTGADAKGYPLVDCHTVDSYRVPWDLGWNSGDVKFCLLKVNY